MQRRLNIIFICIAGLALKLYNLGGRFEPAGPIQEIQIDFYCLVV